MAEQNSEQIPSAKPLLADIKFIAAPEGVLEVYCNCFNINWTLFDIRIRLAQLVPSETADAGVEGYIPRVAKERAALTIAWSEAKQLRDGLIDAVARYEQTNGEIPIPKMPAKRRSEES